jgi:acyl carrier protein
MTPQPTYEEFIESLTKLAGGGKIALDQGLFQQDHIDSIDIVEWLYGLEERYQLQLNEETLELLTTVPVQDLYEPLMAGRAAAS